MLSTIATLVCGDAGRGCLSDGDMGEVVEDDTTSRPFQVGKSVLCIVGNE